MSYYSTCPHCGALMDPGEVCDCILSKYDRLPPENKRKVDSLAFALIDARPKRRDLHATRKGGINVSKADTAGKIVTAAIMYSGSEEDGLDMLESCTRSDFKRAIKRLRMIQRKLPEYAGLYEEAIGRIRRVWLHREVLA